jgi:transposase
MNKYKEIFGVDISKDVFVVYGSKSGHNQFKNDAKAICEYGQINEVPLYTALTDVQSECLQLFRLMDSCLKKRTATKNKIHGEDVLGIPSKYVYRSLTRIRKYLDKEISVIEAKLLSLVKQEQ